MGSVFFGHTLQGKPLPAKPRFSGLWCLYANHTSIGKFLGKPPGQGLHVLRVCAIAMKQQEKLRGLGGRLKDDVLSHADILPWQSKKKPALLKFSAGLAGSDDRA
jgi:hypothetical protein